MAMAAPQIPKIPADGETHHAYDKQQHQVQQPETSSYPDQGEVELEEMNSKLPTRPSQPVVQITNSQPAEAKKKNQPVKSNKQAEESRENGTERNDDPHSPLEAFDWDDFSDRYGQAMLEASGNEKALRAEFERLVEYFGVWASAASQYDTDRSSKRIKTRAMLVQHEENVLEKKKKHYTQVVAAFKQALALLSTGDDD